MSHKRFLEALLAVCWMMLSLESWEFAESLVEGSWHMILRGFLVVWWLNLIATNTKSWRRLYGKTGT